MSSIHEVARQAGVSTATVSRTFSTPDLLSQETRQRVLAVAERLNYQPRRRVARGSGAASVAETSNCLGFVFFAASDETPLNDFYAPVLSGAQSEAARLGMHLIVRTTSRYTRPTEVLRMFRESVVAGTLLVGAALPEVLAAYDAHMPVSVLVDNCDTTGRHDSITTDGFRGAYTATRYLLELGHRQIGFVMDEPTAHSFQERRHGWLCALADAGLTPEPHWTVAADKQTQSVEEVEDVLERAMSAPGRPTAFVAANDLNAFVLMNVCRRRGLSIPGDVSVIGFDDVPFSVHAYPPLTTLRVDKGHFGRLAVRCLDARLQEAERGDTPEPSAQIVVPVSLVERESCRSLT